MTFRKRSIKRLVWMVLIVFIIMNIVAFFHAYKFTHFDTSKTKTKNSPGLSIGEKLKIAVFGISNPRSITSIKPDTTFQTVRLKSNKEIECWEIQVTNPKGTVILFHGYGGEKSSMLDKAAIFRSLGYNIMLVDFMGSGGSEGSQTTIGYKEAEEVKTCFNYLSNKGNKNIILFGTSLGAVAIMKAIHDYQLPVSSIIIECPFSTMLQTVKNRFSTMGIPSFPMSHLLVFWGGVQNGFNAFKHNPVDYARNIKCPTLLLHGVQDPKVTEDEISAIYKNLIGPKKLITFPLAGHENYLTKYENEWTQEVSRFLK